MAAKKWTTWKELKARTLSPERQARIHEEAMAEIRENELRELREIAGKTQADVASVAGFEQSELSRIERREDHLLSTLRRYVEALGGELEVVAVIGDHRVRLRSV
ncbi:MAG: helix-turn-helix transcriptional regulator [Polyangiaceae bacterium]|nr:helix-turn-helix transcriptional regulator [Polyangiaceae bacterium]